MGFDVSTWWRFSGRMMPKETFMSILVRRFLERARCSENLLEDWKIENNQGACALDVGEFVSECIDLAALCKHAWECLWQALRADPNGQEVEEIGRVMKPAIARTQSV